MCRDCRFQIYRNSHLLRKNDLESPHPNKKFKMAPKVGLEPTTNRLTADRSTTELLRNSGGRTSKSCQQDVINPFEQKGARSSFLYPSKCHGYLRERLIDQLHIAIAPVLLGAGERLFDCINLAYLGYTCTQLVAIAASNSHRANPHMNPL